MPNAIETAVKLYGAEFAKAHGAYAEHGYTYTQPDKLLLFRPCKRSQPGDLCTLEDADAWWIELAIGVGAPSTFARIIPKPLPFVGWQRGIRGDLKPRFFPFDKAKALYELRIKH